jgi:hypothetical protein
MGAAVELVEGEDAAARRERFRLVGDRVRPVSLAREHTLPLVEGLEPLFPDGSLTRGITVGVSGPGMTSLAFALAVEASRRGSWTVLVGVNDAGLVAAAELGLALERVAVVTDPPPAQWGAVVAALVGAFDILLCVAPPRLRAGDARRLMARARERGSVLVALAPAGRRAGAASWPERPDVELVAHPSTWQGLGPGHGHLTQRAVRVETTGRRAHARVRRTELWLPGPLGAPQPADAVVVADSPPVTVDGVGTDAVAVADVG